MGSLPGHAETSARWVSPSGAGAGGGGGPAGLETRAREADRRRELRGTAPVPFGRRSSGEAPLERSPGLRRPGCSSKRLQRVVPGASRDTPMPGGGRAGGLFPDSVCRAPTVFTPGPTRREAETPPSPCLVGALSWGKRTRDKGSLPERTPRDWPTQRTPTRLSDSSRLRPGGGGTQPRRGTRWLEK